MSDRCSDARSISGTRDAVTELRIQPQMALEMCLFSDSAIKGELLRCGIAARKSACSDRFEIRPIESLFRRSNARLDS
jgi:hypothetical protein